MPITYKVKPKHNVLGGKNEIRYYAVAARFRTVNSQEVSRILETRSNFTSDEISQLLQSLSSLIKYELSEGNSVHLEGIGVFSLSVSSEGEQEPTDITPEKVFAKKICFKPTADFKSFLRKVEFKPSRRS